MKNNIQYFDQMKESSFLSWFDTTLEGEEVTIADYEPIDIETKTGETEKKWAVYFEEKEKPILLNKTNRNTLSQLFGGRLDQSIGKKVTLYFRDDIEFQGKQTKGLRLKPARREAALI
ncbi:MAG: hypothetical protein SFU25_05645 [Candidatus Caenarcaniphilales bacterium]|nr:hypothetical protein [Candidatus Caenarcaniphilales bacterium]